MDNALFKATGHDVIRFTVLGEPMGAPRMTQSDKWKKRPVVIRYRSWKDAIRAAALKALSGRKLQLEQIAAVNWRAYFVPPPSWSKKKRAAALNRPHRSRPDRDNIDKGILDALFADDEGIHCGHISKLWGATARLEVEIVLENAA